MGLKKDLHNFCTIMPSLSELLMNESDAAPRIARRKTSVTAVTHHGPHFSDGLVCDVFLSALVALLTHMMCSSDDKFISLIFYNLKVK